MSSGSDARVGVRADQRECCWQAAKSSRGERAPRCGPHDSLREGEAAPRGHDSGRGRWCLVVMGDPVPVRVAGPRTVVRYCPSTRIPLPSHAAAAACLSTSDPPAIRHPPRRALSVSPDTTGTAPRPARHVAPRPGSRHAGLPGRHALSVPRRPPWPSWYAPLRALPRIRRTVPLRCVDRLCCSSAARHWRSFSMLLSHAGLFVPATSPVATSVCGAP